MSIEKRLERVEAILDARGLDWDHPRVEEDHFADANKMVADEPPKKWRILGVGEEVREGDWYADAFYPRQCWPPSKGAWFEVKADPVKVGEEATSGLVFARPVADEPAKEPEHPAGPMPDPGEGYRILSKNPPEDLTPGDECEDANGGWTESDNARTHGRQEAMIWYRRKIGFPAKEPGPAWEPKVGDWVRVTRPEDWIEWKDPRWEGSMHKSDGMHKFDGQVGQIEREREGHFQIRGFVASKECSYIFHRDWLSPAEPPKDEYREPVLPADAGKHCQFSDDGIEWRTGWLNGWGQRSHQWVSHSGGHWRHCRIKKDA